MAITVITNTSLTRNEAKEITAKSAVDGTAGAKVNFENRSDGKILLLLTNDHASASKDATIKAGNSLQGTEDLVVSVPAGKTYGVVVESGKYKNVTGDNKGNVIITGASTDIKVQAIELP